MKRKRIDCIKRIAEDSQLKKLAGSDALLSAKTMDLLSALRIFNISLELYEEWYKKYRCNIKSMSPDEYESEINSLRAMFECAVAEIVGDVCKNANKTKI